MGFGRLPMPGTGLRLRERDRVFLRQEPDNVAYGRHRYVEGYAPEDLGLQDVDRPFLRARADVPDYGRRLEMPPGGVTGQAATRAPPRDERSIVALGSLVTAGRRARSGVL